MISVYLLLDYPYGSAIYIIGVAFVGHRESGFFVAPTDFSPSLCRKTLLS